MIIISLMGGLGNQMFQYAAAKHLAVMNDTQLRIDGTRFSRLTANREHTLQLGHVGITAVQASVEEISRYGPHKGKIGKNFNRLKRLIGLPVPGTDEGLVYREPETSRFKPEVLALGADRYLIGYFNSYKYFDKIKALIVDEYTPKYTLSHTAAKIVDKMESTNSVSIHFRRGDYITDHNVGKSVEGIITENYYRNAIDLIASRIGNPHFFLFSNEINWVKENFKISFPTTCVDINPPGQGYLDLWLMSRCKHNIVAGGSTFSWWAAYLNPNEDKIVVRTHKVNNEQRFNHPQDYFPGEWAAVES